MLFFFFFSISKCKIIRNSVKRLCKVVKNIFFRLFLQEDKSKTHFFPIWLWVANYEDLSLDERNRESEAPAYLNPLHREIFCATWILIPASCSLAVQVLKFQLVSRVGCWCSWVQTSHLPKYQHNSLAWVQDTCSNLRSVLRPYRNWTL